ncbi:hypothetical protein K1719_046202 [Acacia pycnantha]|nr:hypothetical protein K1719_046202 [Acacia pycnantha]
MLPRESMNKTKIFFHKTLENFKSFFYGEYRKLPRSLSFNHFSRKSGKTDTYTSEQFYHEFYDQWQSELKRLKMIDEDNKNNSFSISGSKSKDPEMENAAESIEGVMGFVKQQSPEKKKSKIDEEEEDRGKQRKNKKEDLSSEKGNKRGRVHVLVQKMKEVDMMEVDDVEHLLDIEEALHYYSRLKCPDYLDVVDKFLMEMLSEFSVPPRLPSEPNS